MALEAEGSSGQFARSSGGRIYQILSHDAGNEPPRPDIRGVRWNCKTRRLAVIFFTRFNCTGEYKAVVREHGLSDRL